MRVQNLGLEFRVRGLEFRVIPLLYDVATMPSAILMVNIEALMGPKISSTLPTWVLFSRKIGPLK